MKAATLALVVRYDGETPALLETVSDDREITLLESAFDQGESDPLKAVHEHRLRSKQEEDEFGDYVEELLSQPYLRPEIQQHGLQWLKSKIRIEQYQKTEAEAAKTIADFAFRMYAEDPKMTDFSLAGPATIIRIRVFVVPKAQEAPNSQAA